MIGIVITISKGLFFLMKKSLMYKALKGVTGLFTILALVLVGFILTGKISQTQIVRAVSDAPYTIKNTVNKIRNGVPHTTEYISASPIFELGHETILELKTDSQPLQVEALEITFEEPQIVESSDLRDESSTDTELGDDGTIATTGDLQSDMYVSETSLESTAIESEQVISQVTPHSEVIQPVSNGIYIGRYQLHSAYLNGDHSPENQERVADAYVLQRYGSWSAAYQFWLANGWY